jgi:L-amino acid N-acyltransferase YncA
VTDDAPTPAVRDATALDAAAIARVHVASWRATYRGIVPDAVLDRLSVERREAYWRETAADPAGPPVWVAEVAGQVVGFASAGPCRDEDMPAGTGELHAIYLAPQAWGRGLGRALLDHAVADLRARSLDPLVLWVLTGNRRARTFYERQGWRPEGGRRELDFDGTPVEEQRYVAPGTILATIRR